MAATVSQEVNCEPEYEVDNSERRTRRSPSPDICSICLGVYNDKCYTDGCLHMFCFICLLEWAKVKLECPLCKKSFKEIYHTIKSYNEYDVHKVPVPSPPTNDRSQSFRLFPNSIQIDVTWQGLAEARRRQALHRFRVDINQLNRLAGSTRSAPRHSSSANFRRYIYAMELYCEGVFPPGGTNRVREVSPRFFRENPAQTHRLIPWLNRELLAVLPHGDNVNILDNILSAIGRVDLRSSAFRNLIRPFLLRYTEHFAHEFRVFATSPYDVSNFDRFSQYPRRPSAETLRNYNEPVLQSDSLDYSAGAASAESRRRSRWGDHPSSRSTVPITNPYTTRNNHLLSNPDNPLANIRSFQPIHDNSAPTRSNSDGIHISTSNLDGQPHSVQGAGSLNVAISVTPVLNLPHSRDALPTSRSVSPVPNRPLADYSTPFPLRCPPSPTQYNKAPPPEHAHPLTRRPRRESYNSSDSDIMVVEAPLTRPYELVILGDSTSEDEGGTRSDHSPSPEPRKGSAMMNYRRTRLSLSSSDRSSPEKASRRGPFVLERCGDPGLSEASSADESRIRNAPESTDLSSRNKFEGVVILSPPSNETREKDNETNRERKLSTHKRKQKKKKHKAEKKKRKENGVGYKFTDSTKPAERSSRARLPHLKSLMKLFDIDSSTASNTDTTSTNSSPTRKHSSKGKQPKKINSYLSSHQLKILPRDIPSLSMDEELGEPCRISKSVSHNFQELSTVPPVEQELSTVPPVEQELSTVPPVEQERTNSMDDRKIRSNSGLAECEPSSSKTIELETNLQEKPETAGPSHSDGTVSTRDVTQNSSDPRQVVPLNTNDTEEPINSVSVRSRSAKSVDDSIIETILTPVATRDQPNIIASIRKFTKSVIAPKYN